MIAIKFLVDVRETELLRDHTIEREVKVNGSVQWLLNDLNDARKIHPSDCPAIRINSVVRHRLPVCVLIIVKNLWCNLSREIHSILYEGYNN